MIRFRERVSLYVVFLATLAVAAFAAAGAKPNAGDASVDITAVNPDTGKLAAVSCQYYSADGSTGPSRSDSIDPRNALTFKGSDAGFSGAFQGVAVLSSDVKLATVGTVFWSGGETTDKKKWGQYSAIPEATDTLYFPNVVYDTVCQNPPSCTTFTGIQNTIMSVQNTSDSDVLATVTWTNETGVQDFSYSVTLPGYGAVVLDTSKWDTNMADDVPNLPSTSFWKTYDSWSGGVKVTAPSPVLAGAANVIWRQFAASFEAVAEGGPSLYFPAVERREYEIVNNGRFGGGTSRWGGLSVLAVTNLDPSTDATLTFAFKDSLGIIPDRIFTVPLAKGATVRFNTHTGVKGTSIGHDQVAQALDTLPDPAKREWVGSVLVSSSGPEIAGTCNNIYLEYNKADLYDATPETGGSSSIVAANVYRIDNGSFSLLRIANLSSATATFDAVFYSTDGTEKLRMEDCQLTSKAVISPNLNRACYKAPTVSDCTRPWETCVTGTGLGANFTGWIELSADQPLTVTVENWFGGMLHYGMAAYNGAEF